MKATQKNILDACESLFQHRNLDELSEFKLRRIGIYLFNSGFQVGASTNIADDINYGYGELDENGFWEIPVPKTTITFKRIDNLKEPKNKMVIDCLVLGERRERRKYRINRKSMNVYASSISGGQLQYTEDSQGRDGEDIIDKVEWFCHDESLPFCPWISEFRDFETFKTFLKSMQIIEIFSIHEE